MFLILKIACLIAYAMALAGLAGLLGSDLSARMQNVAAVLLILHALEVVFMFKHVRKYRGPLLVSVLLTLLFGLLHWKPLADRRN
jgi:uncharacterized protein YhhL (DUF1145 family)